MKKIFAGLIVALVLFAFTSPSFALCAKIKDGTITDSASNIVTLGYDQYGYNYQAHMFNGLYDNYTRPNPPVTSGGVNLMMKWSDDWLANVDCNGNGKLDRGLDVKTGAITGTSMGWLTNHMEGDCDAGNGETEHYTYFVKIVWVGPEIISPDPWGGDVSVEGKRIWGEYAIIEEVVNNSPPLGDPGVCSASYGRSWLVHPAGFGPY